MITLPPPYEKLVLHPSPAMAGSKKAIRMDGVTYISPAMAALLEGATPDEVTFLLNHIAVVTVKPPVRRPRRG